MFHWELLGRVYDVFCTWYYISLSLAPCCRVEVRTAVRVTVMC